jgi:hypothetical protein
MISDTVKQERERCAKICDGMAFAIKIGAALEWSVDQRTVAVTVAEWLRDEIRGHDEKET